MYVKRGGPPGSRTPNLRIRRLSTLLKSSRDRSSPQVSDLISSQHWSLLPSSCVARVSKTCRVSGGSGFVLAAESRLQDRVQKKSGRRDRIGRATRPTWGNDPLEHRVPSAFPKDRVQLELGVQERSSGPRRTGCAEPITAEVRRVPQPTNLVQTPELQLQPSCLSPAVANQYAYPRVLHLACQDSDSSRLRFGGPQRLQGVPSSTSAGTAPDIPTASVGARSP